MARESFDKEIELLRLLVLTGGAFSRKESAERLGISVHTLDKALRRLREAASAAGADGAPGEDGELGLGRLLQARRERGGDPLLLFLFRSRSLKESEIARLSLLQGELGKGGRTAAELLDACCGGWPEASPWPDEKTIRSDLAYLEKAGIVARAGGRPVRYRLRDELWAALEPEELRRLELFVHAMAHTRVPSVHGFLLQDSLRRLLGRDGALSAGVGFAYRYDCRILDEAYLHPLLAAIEERRTASFEYLTPKSEHRYAARGTNPLHARTSPARQIAMLPLKAVYDHQYGRWYALGFTRAHGLSAWRMEGMSGLAIGGAADPELFARKREQLDARLRTSWLVDLGEPTRVSVRFFRPEGAEYDFVRERVLLQGQWGETTEEGPESFRYDIEVNGTREIRPWLRSFGSSCEVLEPEELRQDMIEEWKELAETYGAAVRQGAQS
ncbi:hypothetical protein B8V81_3147 [Paenibacillus pasadenensis]|uniref:WCX domain-containing protein n=1 Tax=Paenibacillus pasadenensis TaxID=217090 RepID=A0A2N5N313_9BACL|nr:WYL domain-containing protein [Paenibacillus pasadenensis]PLT44716.1 hypothetical protein B8V81_3147 [Paenibacillus pasadenensis]